MYLRLKEILKEKDETIKGLALKIGAANRSMYNWMRADNIPFQKLVAISEVLDCSIYELIEPNSDYDFVFDKNKNFAGVVRNVFPKEVKPVFKNKSSREIKKRK